MKSKDVVRTVAETERDARYWRANLKVIIPLLSIWAVFAFGLSIFMLPWLNNFSIGKVPLGFWIAQQGSIYVFVVLIFVYAWCIDRIDRNYETEGK